MNSGWQTIRVVLAWVLMVCLACSAATERRGGRGRSVTLTGDDFSAWREGTGQWQIVGDVSLNPQDEKLLSGKSGSGTVLNGPKGRTSHLFSEREFGDVRAHIEFMVPKGSNSGIYFMGRYEIQVFDSWGVAEPHHSDCGGIYQRWKDNKGYEGHGPRVNASLEPGSWQTFDVVFRAPRFDESGRKLSSARFEKVVHNGVVIHEDVELYGPTQASGYNDEKARGPLMLQGDHGPVAYRNVRLEYAGALPFFAMDTATKDDKHKTAKEQVEMIKELGYSGMGPHGGAGLAELVEELDKTGLGCVAAYLGVNIDPDKPKYGPELMKAVEILKGRNSMLWLYVQSGRHKPSSTDGDARAEEILRDIAEIAEQNGLRIALYPHTGFWIERVEDAVRVAKRVNRRNVGVTFNLCHWLKVDDEANMESLIKAAMPHLFVVTINGADSGGKNWNQLIQTLDKGTFDVRGFLRTLRRAGYNGPIGFQGYGIGGDAYDNLQRTMGAWRDLSRRRR